MGIAETGSGKTAAFVIPMLLYILQQPKMTPEIAADGPYALVLAPTRELAQQIHSEVQKLGGNLGIRSVVFIGGTAAENQGFLMNQGAEVVIATPGRMISNVKKKFVVLNQCRYIVLDEADRMIDLNFEDDVIEIMDSMPVSNIRPENPEEEDTKHVYRQTFMFSATMPVKVELLARKYLRNPAYVAIGERTGKVNERIEQKVLWVTENQKQRFLRDTMVLAEPPVIVFSNSKKNCDIIAKYLIGEGYSPAVLHSGKSQDQREAALAGFKDGTYDILVATGVAGRGLDIKGVTLVINYDIPKDMESYMHRIGRTGRAGMEGKAVSFITNDDTDIMYDIKRMLIESDCEVPPELARHEAAQVRPGSMAGKQKGGEVIFK
jgi:ATP-dependent RNA helicase DDX23/PRP28